MLIITIPVLGGGARIRASNKLSLIKGLGERGTFNTKEERQITRAGKIQVQEKNVSFPFVLANKWSMYTGYQTDLFSPH